MTDPSQFLPPRIRWDRNIWGGSEHSTGESWFLYLGGSQEPLMDASMEKTLETLFAAAEKLLELILANEIPGLTTEPLRFPKGSCSGNQTHPWLWGAEGEVDSQQDEQQFPS